MDSFNLGASGDVKLQVIKAVCADFLKLGIVPPDYDIDEDQDSSEHVGSLQERLRTRYGCIILLEKILPTRYHTTSVLLTALTLP